MENTTFKLNLTKKNGMIPCPKCEKPTSEELHECPYQCEINDDCSDHCTCCSECSYECAMDI